MRTVLVIASAIVNAILQSANTDSRTYCFGRNGAGRRADSRAALGSARRAARPAAAPARRAADPAALHAPSRDAQPQVRPAGREARPPEAPAGLPAAARRPRVRRPGLQPRGAEWRDARARPLVVGGTR